MTDFNRHNNEIQQNLKFWEQKPILQAIYNDFYSLIVSATNQSIDGKIVEIGSGIGNLKKHIPDCICTDAFDNPWIDQVENAYKLSFDDNDISNLILFDVWHHLEYPVAALNEFHRVLKEQGRIILLEPYISFLGLLVYGVFHPEDVAWHKKIKADKDVNLNEMSYYAAQGNATRFFQRKKYKEYLQGFTIKEVKKIPALAYVMSGGYSKKQMFPDKHYAKIKKIESLLDNIPSLFATRCLIVLEKK